ncbi:hypothetical protein ACPOL_5128 [Acidisarcina polymorpha]|uniref:Uncharacterized protein n=1 Tax=Acidisarcina polymorpha TaxID=2211140 RepID=A0A2Z5G5B5_9BACT|nr:hypothetical protein [Acidisarcina polymorpha]AXC14382.1 hypothetical protein ACPOL_5128 [Acidisarcina polymorpha]
MALDVATLASQMLGAALPILENDAGDAESFAKTEFLKIAQTLAGLEAQLKAGQINQQQAAILFDIQKNASRNVLLTLKGLALLAVEAAINAALGVVKTIVNTALGFALL